MFTGGVVWRGVIYTLLMAFGKLLCGLWLFRFTLTLPNKMILRPLRFLSPSSAHFWGRREDDKASLENNSDSPQSDEMVETPKENKKATVLNGEEPLRPQLPASGSDDVFSSAAQEHTLTSTMRSASPRDTIVSPNPSKPVSLYPSSILGLAMIARGEIGFLISSLAESKSIFSSSGSQANDEIFLIVTWAIVLCTIIGPVGVGLLVRRLKRLEKKREGVEGSKDVSGVWGVS